MQRSVMLHGVIHNGIPLYKLACFVELWYIFPGAAGSSGRPSFTGGIFLPPDLTKGGLTMVTYSDLIQTGILVVAIIALFLQANKKK